MRKVGKEKRKVGRETGLWCGGGLGRDGISIGGGVEGNWNIKGGGVGIIWAGT